MQGSDKDCKDALRREVALFRYGVIAEILRLPRGSPERAALIRARARREWGIPGSSRRRVAETTIRDWLALHEDGGFDALFPKRRRDRGQSRGISAAAQEVLVRLKQDRPHLSVRRLLAAAAASGALPAGERPARSSADRLLRHEGLPGRDAQSPGGKDRRSFGYELAGELWQSDVLHGPKAGSDPADRRRRRKALLVAFIDDATRVVPYAAFAFGERTADVLPVFQQAVLQRGVPERLYADNGAAYRSKDLQVLCAGLDTVLINATPHEPRGKGRIERWFRTVRAQFLPAVAEDEAATASLDALNRHLRVWIESEYHRTPHRGLEEGRTPLEQWALACSKIRPAPPADELRRLFLLRRRRKVYNDRTVRLDGRVCEVGAELVGQRVELLVDPAAPPGTPLGVSWKGRDAGRATPVDRAANARRFPRRAGPARPAHAAQQARPARREGPGQRHSGRRDRRRRHPGPGDRRPGDSRRTCLSHFALTRYSFQTPADPAELFPSKAAAETHSRLQHLLELRGFGLLTGEPGCGKTTACAGADRVAPEHIEQACAEVRL